MLSSATMTRDNSPREYVALMVRTTTPDEHVSRDKQLQLTETSSQNTANANGISAILQANPTIANRFIVLQNNTIRAQVTSGTGTVFIAQGDISFSKKTVETHIRTKNSLSGLFWRILAYPDVQSLSELAGKSTLITWPTPVEEISIILSKITTAEMPAILPDEELSPEDRESRKKGLALVAHVAQLMQTDEGFRDWFQEGFDEIATGHFVTFSEKGWKEE